MDSKYGLSILLWCVATTRFRRIYRLVEDTDSHHSSKLPGTTSTIFPHREMNGQLYWPHRGALGSVCDTESHDREPS